MSDSDDDNIVRYGTPLDPYEEDEVPSKKKYQEKNSDQFALDGHGRRRFHGAFTGGFSAGHGNSVATPEGFTPATFKSSRSEKAQKPSQRPEDFMDDEDRGEFGIAPKLVQTKTEFSGQKRPHQKRFFDGPIPGEPVLEQLVRAVHETAAVKILKSMGWKPGQGAGERVTGLEKRLAAERQKVYGCYIPPEFKQADENESSTDEERDVENLFAPDDYEPYIQKPKNDKFGLGYVGLSRHSVLGNLTSEYGSGPSSSSSHLLMNEKGKKVSIRGQAFGVGALENEDEDIYGVEDMSHYDFEIGGHKGKKEQAKKQVVNKGTLEGFIISSKAMPQVPYYPAPALPRDYLPSHCSRSKSRFQPITSEVRDQGLGRHELSAKARGDLLGEVQTKPIEIEPTETISQPIAIKDMTQKESKEDDYISITNLPDITPKTFRPFASNPQKQLRYERFLKGEKDNRDSGDRVDVWEKERELLEFEQAAKLYRPLSGVMSDRFTHASEPDDQPTNPLAVVARSKQNKGQATPAQIEAANSRLYGVMTRSTSDWRPESLVCKRFNIPDPYATRPDKKDEKTKVSYSIFEYLEQPVHDKQSFMKEQSKFSGSNSIYQQKNQNKDIQKPIENIVKPDKIETTNKRITVAELFLKEAEEKLKDNDNPEVIEQAMNKFDKMELYNAIFQSDTEEEIETENSVELLEKPKNVIRNDSPPRGIFANINFDELNKWNKDKNKDSKSEEVGKKDIISNVDSLNVDNEIDMYGPKIPETLKKRLEDTTDNYKPKFVSKSERDRPIEVDSSSGSDSWVEEDIKAKKSKKKKSKSHKKHKKSKHKKKSK